MKKLLYGFLYSLVAILLTTQVVLWADGVGVNVKPTETILDGSRLTRYNSSYAHMHLHTSVGQFYNLSTTSYQTIKNFSFTEGSNNVTLNGTNGTVTFNSNASGKYTATFHINFEATEGSKITMELLKNGIIEYTTSREMAPGSTRTLSFLNISAIAGDSTIDLLRKDAGNNTWITQTNITSTMKRKTYLLNKDFKMININESATAPGINLKARFDYVRSPKFIGIDDFAYDGNQAGHGIHVQALNTVFNRYTNLTDNVMDITHAGTALPTNQSAYASKEFVIPTPSRNYVNSQGQVFARLLHATGLGTATHDLQIDRLQLKDYLNSIIIEISNMVDLMDGDTLQLRIKSNIPGTEFYIYDQGLEIHRISQ